MATYNELIKMGSTDPINSDIDPNGFAINKSTGQMFIRGSVDSDPAIKVGVMSTDDVSFDDTNINSGAGSFNALLDILEADRARGVKLDNEGKLSNDLLPDSFSATIRYATFEDFPLADKSGAVIPIVDNLYIDESTGETYRYNGTDAYVAMPAWTVIGEIAGTITAGDIGFVANRHYETRIGTTGDRNIESDNLADIVSDFGSADSDYFGKVMATNRRRLAVSSKKSDSIPDKNDCVELIDVYNNKLQSGFTSNTYILEYTTPDSDVGFGKSIAMNEDIVAIGAPSAGNNGEVLLFSANDGSYIRTISPSTNHTGSAFGSSIAINDTRIAIGETSTTGPGYVYAYNIDGTGETYVKKTNDVDGFATALALDGDNLVIGAPDEAGEGRAYLTSISLLANEVFTEIPNESPQSGSRYGCSVAIHGDNIAVGAEYYDGNYTDSGCVTHYRISDSVSENIILPSSYFGQSEGHSRLGRSVSISDRFILSGSDQVGMTIGSYHLSIINDSEVTNEFELISTNYSINPDSGECALSIGDRLFLSCISTSGSGALSIQGIKFTYDKSLKNSPNPHNLSGMDIYNIIKDGSKILYNSSNLYPSDGEDSDLFGYSVAISGDLCIVGAYHNDDNGGNSGSAYIFDVNTGQQLFKLLPGDGAANDYFGYSVAVSGDRCIVGAYSDDDNGSASGSAYIFDVTTGQQLFKLLPSDGESGDDFGYSVSISGDRCIVGAYGDDDNGTGSGSAYIFDVSTGQQLFKLVASDGADFDLFGKSVSISGDRCIVGAHGDDDNGTSSGSAYIFDVTTGQQLLKLLPSDGESGYNFGYSVSISGNRCIVGVYRDNDNGNFSGSAYIFDVNTGQQMFKLLPSDGAENDYFGRSVSIIGDRCIVGADGDDDNGDNSGSAYIFDVTTGEQLLKLLPSDGESGDNFGASVSISGDLCVAGAKYGKNNGVTTGAAYIFRDQIYRLKELIGI